MTCSEFRERAVERTRGGPWSATLEAHADTCAECARFLESQRALSAALAELAVAEIPSPEVFAEPVMAEFDHACTPQPQAWRWILGAGIAAALALAVLRTGTPEAPSIDEENPFVAIPYTVPPVPGEYTTVARMEIPVPALIAAGFRVEAADPAAVVDADVLVGEDGRVRAIRIRE
jgi:hypothetical protein